MTIFDTKKELFPHLMEGMNSLRKDKSLYDVCIKIGDHQITAHKSVLLPVSDYFKSLFLGPFKTNEHIVEVDFSSVALDVECAEAIIDFLYTGVINIDDENLEAILKLATFLLIQQIQDLCIKYMEQSCILDTYMWYFLLSVDYMVSDAEEIVMKTVKARFHDYFIFEDSTKALSLFHLNRLVEDYEIFENCMKIDTLSFLVDWVLNGKSDEHETFACKVLDSLRVEKPRRKEYQGSYNNPRIDDGPGNENEKSRSEENVESVDEEPSRNQRRGFNITVAIEEIKHKLKNTTGRSKLRQKCEEVIERCLSINAADVKDSGRTIKEATAEHLSQQKSEASVEQVLIAVTPKKHLAEFLQKTESSKSEMEHERDEVTFNVCIYKPRTKTWYYFEENTRNFNDMGRKSSTWPINFCMHNKLCCVSPEEKELRMYPLTNNSRGRYWSSTSYKELVRKFPEFDCIKDVSFFCSNRETVYLVAKKKGYTPELKIKFKCYRLSKQESQFFTLDTLFDFNPPWVFLFATPCIYELEDPDVFDSKSFDVHVSLDNKQMIIVVKGLKLHAFVVNLEDRAAAIQHHVMSDEDRRLDLDDIWYQNVGKLMLLSKGDHLSCVDEIHVNAYGAPNMYYRNVIIGNQEEMHVHNVDHDYTDTHLPNDYDFDTHSKLVESVKDGKSIWLYASDGKFETSMKEMRLNKYGYLDFHEHIPPPFASVKLIATGLVKKEHIAELKPIVNF